MSPGDAASRGKPSATREEVEVRRALLAGTVVLACWLVLPSAASAQQAPDALTDLIRAGAPISAPASPTSQAGVPAAASPVMRDQSGDTSAVRSGSLEPSAGAAADVPGIPNPLGLLGALDPREWAADILDAVISAIGRSVLEALRGFIDWATGLNGSSFNFVTQTPAAGTYDSVTVRSLWDFTRALANAALAIIVMWGGFNVVVKEHTRSPYHSVMELLPRVMLAALAVNLTLELARLLVDLNNAFAGAVGDVALPGYEQTGVHEQGMALVFVAVAHAIVVLLLVFQMLMRLALIDVLIVLAPVMVVLWVLPQTQSWARWWGHIFPITVFQQAVQVIVLRLGTALMVELTPGSVSNALLTLLLGIAVCWLTLKVPALLNGQARHAGLGSVASLVVLSRVGGAIGQRAGAATAGAR